MIHNPGGSFLTWIISQKDRFSTQKGAKMTDIFQQKDRISEKLLGLGFSPVEFDFQESGWRLIEELEGDRHDPAVWMRLIPEVGDQIFFDLECSGYVGTVNKRAFQAISATELFSDPAEPCKFYAGVALSVVDLKPRPKFGEGSIWEEGDGG
jgi:hypothetical protein